MWNLVWFALAWPGDVLMQRSRECRLYAVCWGGGVVGFGFAPWACGLQRYELPEQA